MSTIADAIIIGGGVHGASLAFHLTKRGMKPVVLERRFIASEATGRSSGLVRMHYDLEPESNLAWESFQYFRNWKDAVGGDCNFTRTGFIQIIRPGYEDQLRKNVVMHQRIGIPTFLVDAEDVLRLAPDFKSDDIEIAAYEPESGYADPSAATTTLMDTAREHGAQLVQNCLVTEIHVNAGKVGGVMTSRGDFSAPIVVNAAGARAAEVGRMVNLDIPVDTWRHDVIFIQRPPEMSLSHPTVIDDANSMYFRPETGKLTLVGLEDGNPIGESPDGFTDRAKQGFPERAFERICRRIPAMEGGALHSSLGGYDGITPDQRAILGQAGPEGFFLACGFSGTGFKIAPAVGACMAELIVDGHANTVDITPFSPERFIKGELLTGEHAYGKTWH